MAEQSMQVFKTNAPATKDDDFDEMSSGGGSPRMSLCTANTQSVKDGEFPTNTYALTVGETVHELGKNVDVVVCAYRLTAIDTSEGFCCSHDAKSDLFIDIRARADEPNSFGCGCIYGQEFLVWVPQHKTFATLLCGSKTSRNMAGGIKALVGEVAAFGSKKFENPKFSWFGMTVAPSNAAVTEAPSEEDFASTVDKFVNDKGVERELAEAEDGGADER